MAERKRPKTGARKPEAKPAPAPAPVPLPDGPERAQTPDLLGEVPAGPRVIGYARISTEDQVLHLQRQALTAAGAAIIHVDEGLSGATMDRPGLHAALAELRPGDSLAVWKLDRLGRCASDLLVFLTDLERRGVRFRSLTEGFDTSTPAGRAMLQMVGVFAELERETLRERVKAGIAAARRNGTLIGRRPALKAHQADHARELYRQGRSQAEIARIMGVGRATVQRHLAKAD